MDHVKLVVVWHGWRAFRRGLATNLHKLGVSDKVIQRILRHANVSTTINLREVSQRGRSQNDVYLVGKNERGGINRWDG